ncbi:MAG: lysophospholipid acyltransferase family protein [Syntrophales bacterium]
MGNAAKRSIILQYIAGWAAIVLVAPAYFLFMRIRGYRIRDLKKTRRECLSQFEKHPGPWIICANHLTMIDSAILTYAMVSFTRHLTQFRILPWNLPERDNFQKNIFLSVLCYLTKCIPVNRGGDRDEMKKTLEKCNVILRMGQNLMIFPEGGRSRTGRINREGFSYGVGRFIKDFENCMVMCIYMRGDGQDSYGTMPEPGERFTVSIEVFRPEKVGYNGLRAQREYAQQVIKRLSRMEEEYFDAHRQRHCELDGSGSARKERRCPIHQSRLYVE